ncbi:MAG TPA: hypothetical protein VGD98_07125 [Ktedonobacteraceae bacterium]
MPVLESTDGGTPRSVLRYRMLDDINKQRSVVTTAAHPLVQRASRARPRPADDDLISEWKRGDVEEQEEIEREERITNPPRKTSQPVRHSSDEVAPVVATRASLHTLARPRLHPLLLLGLGMLSIFVLWTLLAAGIGWWNGTMDTLHYGNPRTFQVDEVVGHNDSLSKPSHFIALNLHGHIEIIEFPGGDGAQARVYLGPQLFGTGADKAPVTLKFVDVNGDRRLDMLAFFQSSWIVLINDPRAFRAPTSDEQQGAVRYLAAHPQT